jgi:hypothetical protein
MTAPQRLGARKQWAKTTEGREGERLTYISEKLAIKVLSKNTGRNISLEDMTEYSELGVVPAYMKFKPKNKTLYPSKTFHAIPDSEMLGKTLSDVTAFDCYEQWQILPFPLPDDGVIKTKDGLAYRFFAARSDGRYEVVSDQHFVRVYARDEMTQASKNVDDYESNRGLRPIAHSCGEQWDAQPPDPENWKDWFVSPFADSDNVINPKKRMRKSISPDSSSEKDQPSLTLIMGCMLELIKDISEKKGGRRYTQTEIRKALHSRFPEEVYKGMGMSTKSIDNAFSDANKKRVASEKAARDTAKVIAAFDKNLEK